MSLTLREWRRVKEISQEDLAAKLNVSTGTIRNWETSPGKIPFEKAVEISKALGLEMTDINFTAVKNGGGE